MNEEQPWMIPETWQEHLHETLRAPESRRLIEFVNAQRVDGTVYPAADQVFQALYLTPYDKVRVVILGHDPYHGEGQAHGLAFSVADGKNPPSLRKILNELERDPRVSPPASGNLESWANQGVLLLNTVLTVNAARPNSHRRKGWEQVTDAVIRAVNDGDERVVCMLWGTAAQKKAHLVKNSEHCVIATAHPAARANAKRPLIGSDAFSRANDALTERHRGTIDWGRD